MRPIRVSQTGVGSTQVIPLDVHKHPFAVGFGAKVTGAGCTFTVEHTFDDVFAPGFNPATATWYPHPSATAKTANTDSNYAFPVTGIRATVTAGTGGVDFTVIQAGL